MEENTQLPKEVVEQIRKEEETLFDEIMDSGTSSPINQRLTAYATKLHQANETIKVLTYENNKLKGEVEGLNRWKEETKAIINPIWEYADTLRVPLGESKTEAVVKQAEQARKLLYEVFRKHESGLLPDRFIYEKIKKFLYGE